MKAKAVVLASLVSLVLSNSALAQNPKTEDEKTLYALGLILGQRLSSFALSKAELEIVKKGLSDAVTGAKAQVELEKYGPKIDELNRSRSAVVAKKNEEAGKAFLDKAGKEKGASTLPSGLVYIEQKAGTGNSPKATDTVKVHYVGTLTNGTEFDSSVKRGQPAEFPLNGVIPCWTEGVQKMKVGGKSKLVCPANIAYGEMGRPPQIPGGSTLVFEIELLEVKAATPPPALPPAPGTPPAQPKK